MEAAFARLDAAVSRAVEIRREIARLEAAFAVEVDAALLAAAELRDREPGAIADSEELAQRAVRAELACALRVSERQAERWIAESRTLVRELPDTLEALSAGLVSRRAAGLVAEASWSLAAADADGVLLPEDERRTRAREFDALAADLARRVPEHRLRGRLVAARDRLHAVRAVERHRAAAEGRFVSVTAGADGMAWLTAFLPAVEAYAIHERLTRIAMAIRTDGAETDPAVVADEYVPGLDEPIELDESSLDRMRADLVADSLLGLSRFRRFDTIRPTVVVTVPALTLLEREPDHHAMGEVGEHGMPVPRGAPPTLEGYGPIDPATARRLAAEAPGFHRLLTDPHTGARLDLSRTTYRPSAELRLWLRLRDETCRFPGCGRRAEHCDLDHTVAWEDGGATSSANLAHLCRGHHTLKHHSAWRIARVPGGSDGELRWTSPMGREYVSRPA